VGNRLAFTATDRTGCAYCEKALVSRNLTDPAALTAGFRTGSRFTATAVAPGAYRSFFYIDLCFRAKSSIHKAESQVIAQVSAALYSGSGTSAGTESEEIVENIAEARKDVFKSAETGKAGPFKPCMTVLVVDGPFFSVVQNFICFSCFLKIIFSFFIAGISIRMVF
jgi:hypothetical protein